MHGIGTVNNRKVRGIIGCSLGSAMVFYVEFIKPYIERKRVSLGVLHRNHFGILICRLVAAYVHDATIRQRMRKQSADKDNDKRKMKQQNIPFPDLLLQDIGCAETCGQSPRQTKPPAPIYVLVGKRRAFVVLYNRGNGHQYDDENV